MTDIDKYLRECVYYPCSGLHGTPVKFLGKKFQKFFYADYMTERKQLEMSIRREGFRGYQLCAMEEIDPEIVFGMSWEEVKRKHYDTISRVPFPWFDPFVLLCRFKRKPHFMDDHGPEMIELMFTRCEAIATFISAFSRRNIAPQCLVHVRSGIGFGGNFSAYPKELKRVLLANTGGLPKFMLYDRLGSTSNYGDYLDLVEKYEPVEKWGYPDGGHLTLAKLIE